MNLHTLSSAQTHTQNKAARLSLLTSPENNRSRNPLSLYLSNHTHAQPGTTTALDLPAHMHQFALSCTLITHTLTHTHTHTHCVNSMLKCPTL